MSNTPLYDALVRYAAGGALRMHMPGHSGHGGRLRALAALAPFDVTELPCTGDAFTGEGPVGQALELADRFYGGTTLFSAGGATLCLQAALAMMAAPGSRIVIDRRCHKAVLNAAILLGLEPVWLYPEGEGASAAPSPESLASLLRGSGARACCITSPTYYGLVADCAGLIAAAHASGAQILFDNAHGAHLACERALHPFFLGADFTVDSFHKTLPALTGAAMLHCHRSRGEALAAMRLFGSTSPSFPVLASLDLARAYLEEDAPADYAAACARAAALRAALAARTRFSFPSAPPGCRLDPLRLTLCCDGCAESGRQVSELLAGQGILLEMADARYAVAILTLQHRPEEFARLQDALCALPLTEGGGSPAAFSAPPLSAALPPREAFFAPQETLPLAAAGGRIAAEPLYFYPPGIPLCVPGERLTSLFCERFSPHFARISVVK